MLARYYNMMGNNIIYVLEMIIREIKFIFCYKFMVDRIVGMFNYFLFYLVCNNYIGEY